MNDDMPHAMIRGRAAVSDPDSNGPFHHCNRAQKQTYFSPFHLRPKTVCTYIDACWEVRLVWIEDYTSSMHTSRSSPCSKGSNARR